MPVFVYSLNRRIFVSGCLRVFPGKVGCLFPRDGRQIARNLYFNLLLMDRNKQKELPRIDLPELWIAGTDIDQNLLGLYTDFPVRLKCEMFILCLGGEVDASVNLNSIHVGPLDVVLLLPGTIFQIHKLGGELKIYFLGFSDAYIKSNCSQHLVDARYLSAGSPVISLKQKAASLLEDYFKLLIRLYEFSDEKGRKLFADNLFADVHLGINILYKDRSCERAEPTKNEQLFRSFAQLVTRNYSQTRQVEWYAEHLHVSHAYLCSVVKEVTGSTCTDIISSMVIMDAKSQLKLTDAPIQAISDSLNFANISFFGKYFKRYVGMSPLEYRAKG